MSFHPGWGHFVRPTRDEALEDAPDPTRLLHQLEGELHRLRIAVRQLRLVLIDGAEDLLVRHTLCTGRIAVETSALSEHSVSDDREALQHWRRREPFDRPCEQRRCLDVPFGLGMLGATVEAAPFPPLLLPLLQQTADLLYLVLRPQHDRFLTPAEG